MDKSMKKLLIKAYSLLFTKIGKPVTKLSTFLTKEGMQFIEPAAQSDTKEDKIKPQKDIAQLEITRRCDLFSKRMSTIGMINIPLIKSPFITAKTKLVEAEIEFALIKDTEDRKNEFAKII